MVRSFRSNSRANSGCSEGQPGIRGRRPSILGDTLATPSSLKSLRPESRIRVLVFVLWTRRLGPVVLITETVSPAANGWAKATGQSIEDVRRIEMARRLNGLFDEERRWEAVQCPAIVQAHPTQKIPPLQTMTQYELYACRVCRYASRRECGGTRLDNARHRI
jgi:hypothetical protein